MKKISTLALGSVAILAGISYANAADVTRRPAPAYVPPPVVAPAPAAYNWSGAYVGLTGAYGWTNFGAASTVSSGNGFLGGGYVGYNMQTPSNWVFGLEADALWSGIRGSAGTTHADLNWLSTLRGRAGYAFDRFLVYGTGGLAVASGELSDGTVSQSNTHLGWTVGAGVETALSQNVTARLEYDYVKLGNKDYALGTAYSTAPSANLVKVGIGFKF